MYFALTLSLFFLFQIANGQTTATPAECIVNDNSQHAILAAVISKSGLDFALDAAHRQAEVEVAKLTIPDQAFSGSGYNVKANNIKIEQFTAPTITYQLLPPSSIKIMIKGGDFRVCAKWSAKAAFIPASGDVCVWSENKKGVDVELTVAVTVDPKGQVKIATSNCKINVPVDLKMTGAIGAIVRVLSNLIESKIEGAAQTSGCQAVNDQVHKKVNALLEGLPTQFKVDPSYAIAYSIRALTISDDGIKAQLATNGTFVPVKNP